MSPSISFVIPFVDEEPTLAALCERIATATELVALLRGYGIKEMVRTGTVVMSRGAQSIEEATRR